MIGVTGDWILVVVLQETNERTRHQTQVNEKAKDNRSPVVVEDAAAVATAAAPVKRVNAISKGFLYVMGTAYVLVDVRCGY